MKMMRKSSKGFTLVELLMVVIIIGILATLAIPNYMRSVERSKGSKGVAGCDAIRKAGLQYRAFYDTFPSALDESLLEFDLPEAMVANVDPDWAYGVLGDEATMTITATRQAGQYAGDTIEMDRDGVLTSSNAVIFGIRQ